ncbi:HigA family addiction module antitoxin [Veillonella sp. T11011-6]|uniref:HigA family addiction module antitoxin n=1 Tax=Veillonella sp. T11011-6 TaxID=2027459 RepID=UPI000CF3F9A8|nr:HigA family addiction module antitoxin [Veillonella sp. T11011-6]PQL10248.1 addiction module antidote protein, HigA family [Veillonella sp. T11011-6]
MKIYRSKTFTAVPPGMTIKEVLEDHHMTQKELAVRLGLSEKHISKLINGEVPLTQDVAIRLERVLDIEASFWNGLEAAYREAILKVEYENSIDEEINFAKPFGYAKLARLGIVPETKKAAEQVNNLQKFFEVASLKNVDNEMVMPLVYENIKDMEPAKKSAIYTLVQITKGQARFVEVNPYDAELLRTFIPKIEDLKSEPLAGVKEPLKDMLGACGVIIVYLPILDNITSTCITYSKGNSIVLGIPTEDTDGFWKLLGEALHNLAERDYQRSNRKYRNNDPVTVVNY